MSREVFCVLRNQKEEGLEQPPYPGDLGQQIFEQVSKVAWVEWLELQKMLVNEYRLNMADKNARKYLMEQTRRHFFGEGADTSPGFVPVEDKS